MSSRCIAGFLMVTLWVAPAARAGERFDPFSSATLEDRLGTPVPADLVLRDATGRAVALADLLGTRPALIAPVDLDCRNICGVTLGGLFGALDMLDRKPGEAFELLVVSIDPDARPPAAARAKARHSERFETAPVARFLTGDARPLLDAIGFRYTYDPATDQYAHPAAVAVLTPDGRLARWLFGYPFEPFDLRLALGEADEQVMGSLAERLWLLCFRYDPTIGAYTPAVLSALQAGGALTMLIVGGGILVALRREQRRRR